MTNQEQQQQAAAEQARADQLLMKIVKGETQAIRMQAGRELGVVSPEGHEPVETRIVIRAVRQGGMWWGAIEAGNRIVSNAVKDDPEGVEAFLQAAVKLATAPHKTDKEGL